MPKHSQRTGSTVIAPTDLVTRVRCEFLEMPGLQVTPAQAARLWHVDQETACAVLDTLTDTRFLVQTRAGSYARRSD
jgi:hypothetical protein